MPRQSGESGVSGNHASAKGTLVGLPNGTLAALAGRTNGSGPTQARADQKHKVRCLRRLRMEQENVRAALDWVLSSSALAKHGVELASALFWFWTKCGLYEEGRLRLEHALAVDAPIPPSLRARLDRSDSHAPLFRGTRSMR